jgi:hypothetical protein
MIMDLSQKLILIEVDHGLMIMEEGIGWPITDTCKG